MKKKYFTALIPASNLDSSYKKIQCNSDLFITLPPVAILEYHKDYILKKDFNKDINDIKEFKTQGLATYNDWCTIKLPDYPLNTVFNKRSDDLFPPDFCFILGKGVKSLHTIPEQKEELVRNWEVGFFEFIYWDQEDPFSNFEFILHWKIKKKKPKY
ncbi:MAG: hypothetical protein JXR64_11490 [Spirochaetales bacterium]|nr:hypothetical protein [Spirochaetales bacterium]